MERIRTGDRVVVTTGPEKGNQGDVLAVNKQKNTALVSGVRRVKKHTKPSQDNPG
nr:50S ribosomal protein L24 [Alphaproteobacteria bacterium]